MAKILIIEDEKAINDLIKFNLELVDHKCCQIYDGKEGLELALTQHYDLIILDIMLPRLSGFEIMKRINGTPVIFLTAKTSDSDKIKGLRLGADDYITKPFNITELVERVQAVLRRTMKVLSFFEFDDIKVDFASKTVYKSGTEITLKPKEYELFEVLVSNRNIAMTREKLISLVWGYDFEGESRTVDVHIQRLRLKLGLSDRLKTVYKLGYRLEI